MIYIGTTEDNGSAIYFDIYAAERQGRGLRISGTVGDGCYEGEVLVEVGRNDSVTFADAWLGGTGFKEFITRCRSDVLEMALLDSVRELPIFHSRAALPHVHAIPCGETVVSEPLPFWNSAT